MFETRQIADITLISLPSQLVVETRLPLRPQIEDLLRAGRRRFVLDCQRTHEVDASGLAMILSVHTHVERAHGLMILAGAQAPLVRMIDAAYLTPVLRTAPNLGRAIEALGGRIAA